MPTERPTPPVVTAKDEEQALKLAGPIVAGLVAPPRDEEAHSFSAFSSAPTVEPGPGPLSSPLVLPPNMGREDGCTCTSRPGIVFNHEPDCAKSVKSSCDPKFCDCEPAPSAISEAAPGHRCSSGLGSANPDLCAECHRPLVAPASGEGRELRAAAEEVVRCLKAEPNAEHWGRGCLWHLERALRQGDAEGER